MSTDLIARLDAADATPDATRLRARTYDLLRAAPGALVAGALVAGALVADALVADALVADALVADALVADALMADVGCGAGRAVAELTARGVRAVGVDLDERMIAAARTRLPDADLRVADACALPFRDGELAGYRADKLFHNLPDPALALSEARRALASGGRIVLCGQDWDTLVLDSSLPDLTRALVHARADRLPSPRAARQYRSLLLDAGFHDVTVEVHTAVFTDPAILPMLTALAEPRGADDWLADQRERARTDRLFAAVPFFVASGANP
ncbi:methyltransferase domain-containing protein [Actinomadura opuntiae]|uniref:methyltransferase domain-containing protein n=1 Tax=Actinomadura sp. OS1-43 TaxID=604315 RepID=UPI00255A8827|nr:methyltransferase domain-containing protein [Actinomadura sp. OS1-43]MDL4814904.1 methyltransferase domain-containing protein [Actinomadura sp. OS1-43]